jgi:hypothetical protein
MEEFSRHGEPINPMPAEASFERRGVKAGPQATAQAARSGLYASKRIHHGNWFEFERTRRDSNHGQAGFPGVLYVAMEGFQAQTGGIDLAPENSQTVTNGANLELSRCTHRD